MKRAKSKNYENEEVKTYKNMKLNKKYYGKKWEMAQMKAEEQIYEIWKVRVISSIKLLVSW